MTFATVMAYDFKVDGIYYKKMSDTEVAVTYGDNQYEGDVKVPGFIVVSGKEYVVKSITDKAFYGCSSLTSIELPNSVTRIGSRAFQGCTCITDVTCWAETPPSIYENTFDDESYENTVLHVLPSSFGIYHDVLYWKYFYSIESMDIKIEVDGIYYDRYAYDKVKVTFKGSASDNEKTYKGDVVIPDTIVYGNVTCFVTDIGESAFYSCDSLTGVTIPNTVKTIGRLAFEGCKSLQNVELGDAVESLGYMAFGGCEKIKK